MSAVIEPKRQTLLPLPGPANELLHRPALILALMCTALGLLGLLPQLTELWGGWTTDPLRSIGLLLPPVSLWLALRSWSWSDFERGGNWWGFPLMAAALLLVTLKYGFRIEPVVYLGQRYAFTLVPSGAVLCAYFSGAVLLFGGTQAWRKAGFALLLWLFANPVPQVVGVIDMPLQTIAARSARAFAEWLSVPVSGDALTLMFSPKLGMFLAPGCNGLRGAATMGYLALVLGHLRGLSLARLALFVATAVAFAYVLNLVRLFFVILYYWLALRLPSLGHYGAEIDYLIGGAIFLAGAAFLLRATGPFKPCVQNS
jgi:exosortase J